VTTGSTAESAPLRSNRFLLVLSVLFSLVWIWSAVRPEIPEDWFLENLLVFVLIGLLVSTYRWLRLSDLSYLLIFIFLSMHEAGAHYQYSAVPLGDWIKPLLHATRNHYDRLVHFSFGLLLAYPQREVLMRKAGVKRLWANVLPVLTTLAFGALYEIIEAVVAALVDAVDGQAFLGSQGDPWDSQQDMFMGFLGSCVAMILVALSGKRLREAI